MINQGIAYTLPYLGGFDTYFKHRHLIFISFSYTDVTIKFLYSKEKSELITLSLFLKKSALFSICIVLSTKLIYVVNDTNITMIFSY